MPLVSLSGVAVEFGGVPVVGDVNLSVSRGERWGILGRNGSGKTTILNVIAGRLDPTRGTVARESGLRIALLDQLRDFGGAATVWEAAASPLAHLLELEVELQRHADALAHAGDAATPEMLARYDDDLERFAREGGYEMEARVDAVLDGLGFDHVAARTRPAERLSGGEAGRIGLARQLVAPADVVLLDEPTNHLDLETTRWLEAYLESLDATVVLVSHDRTFLEAVVDHTLHVDEGTAVPYTGSYSAFVTQHTQRALERERAYAAQQRRVEREEEYIRRNIAGQNSRQAKGRRTRLARLPRLSPPPREDDAMALRLEPGARGGNQVLVLDAVRLAVGGHTLLESFTATVHRGEVVGLVGVNGSGKSTLLNAIAGARAPDGGDVRIGASIDAAYYRQDMGQVPEGKALFDIVGDLRPSWDRGQIQGYLGRFGFPGKAVQRTADGLSGGERARVALALLMLSQANLLLLDEPTNHLDVESVEVLEDALEGYPGTVLLASHDRALLRTITTRVWSLESRTISDYPGSFGEWEEARDEREAASRRDATAAEEARKEREARASRKDREREKAERKRARNLRKRAEAAEAEAHRLEAKVIALREALADASLYTDAEGVQRAVALKVELTTVERELSVTLDAWAEAEEAAQAGS